MRDTEYDSIRELTLLVGLLADGLAPLYGLKPYQLIERLLEPRRRSRLKRLDERFVYEG